MQYHKVENCLICQKSDYKNHLIVKDHAISQESFALMQCKNCSFIFTNPRPSNEDLSKYYLSPEYDSHKANYINLKDIVYRFVRRIAVRQKLAYITSLRTGKALLDVGCGTGYFLNHCQNNGWTVEGVEPNIDSIKAVSDNLKIYDNIDAVKDTKYDVITFWHSLEHIPEITSILHQAKSALKKSGKIIIAVPNIDSYDSAYYKEYWAGLDVPRHLYHFTPITMKKLLKNFDLKLEKILPMKFDAYYVSLLSERYKSGKMDYVQAYKKGRESNEWAKNNLENFSSLMYTVIKK